MARKLALFAAAAALLVAAAPAAPATAAGLLAPPSVCSSQSNLEDAVAVQDQSMLCLTNYARGQLGLGSLEAASDLELSASEKSRDIFRCDSFSHYACGREFTYWMRETGYLSASCWRAGENLAWGTNSFGTVRAIFRAWLRSPEHRENILGDFTQIGIDQMTGTLAGRPDTHVWTQHFGSHCEAAPALG